MFSSKGLLLAAVVGCASVPAQAAPVSLNCYVDNPRDGRVSFDVQLNEEAGQVSYFIPSNGTSVTVRGIFTPDKVQFNSFTVSRTDLAFSRQNDGAFARMRNDPPFDNGKCVISTAKRAF